MLPRFYTHDALSLDSIVVLEDEEFRHAKSVLRLGVGDEVTVINGKGALATAVISSMGRSSCQLHVQSCEMKDPPQRAVFLGLSLLRPGHLDFAVEKVTEFGVTGIVLFPAEKSDRKNVPENLHRRLAALTVAAMKQSGQLFQPSITLAKSLEHACSLLPAPRLFADLQPEASFLPDILPTLESDSVSILIGPESGWSDNEKQLLASLARPTLLHPNTLRAETAAIAAVYVSSLYLRASLPGS
jgi:16S rRNA (uracil1498-N3)-methyltransferase